MVSRLLNNIRKTLTAFQVNSTETTLLLEHLFPPCYDNVMYKVSRIKYSVMQYSIAIDKHHTLTNLSYFAIKWYFKYIIFVV